MPEPVFRRGKRQKAVIRMEVKVMEDRRGVVHRGVVDRGEERVGSRVSIINNACVNS